MDKKLIVICNQGQSSEFLQSGAHEKGGIAGCHQHEDCRDIEYCDCDDGAPCPGGSVGVCYPGCRDQVQLFKNGNILPTGQRYAPKIAPHLS